MNINYGLNRVLEPASVLPVSAWKMDNRREITPEELRISLHRIQMEETFFRKLCNSCGFDEEKIKTKVLTMIALHGKIYNPFSHSGGALLGTIEEIGKDALNNFPEYKIGNKVCCLSPLSSLPLYIQEISEIDYHYGQILCSGYAILFSSSKLCLLGKDLDEGYTLEVMSHGDSLYSAYRTTCEQEHKKIIIIGIKEETALVYASAVQQEIENCEITCICDKASCEFFTPEEVREILHPYIRDICFVDLSDPLSAAKNLADRFSFTQADQVIVNEDIYEAAALAVILVKPGGDISFTSVDNHYADARMVADSISKKVIFHTQTECAISYSAPILSMIRRIYPALRKIDLLYQTKKNQQLHLKNTPHHIEICTAGESSGFVYQSPVTRNLVEDILNIARYDCNVIIQGETGVGKEKVLSLLHEYSERSTKPCIKINCATIHENLAESEFFGYEPGAFTGAQASGKIGYFELANNGILFLDEIGSLSLNMQSKLLRVLQENQFYRVGGTQQINVDVRVVVANNVPLQDIVSSGDFREDLYYRLNICKITVPPLRERKEDILCLAETFVSDCTKKYKVERELSEGALRSLYHYNWPGNVRELENVIQRLIISSRNHIISSEDVDVILNEGIYEKEMPSLREKYAKAASMDFRQLMEDYECKLIEYAIKKEGTTRKAADFLGIPQATLARKKLKYNL